MPNMTVATGAVYIPEMWSKRVQHHTESSLVLANLVARFDDDVSENGDKVHIPFDTELVANNKLKGVSVTTQNPTDTEIELDIDKHKESSFIVEDILKAQAKVNILDRYTKNAGYAIAKAIDSDLAALATGFSNNQGVYNTAITTDTLLNAIEVLDLGDVPMEDRHFVFRADVKRDLLDISTYTSADFIGGRPVESGKLAGQLYGVNTYLSNNILKTGNNTSNMLFHRNAIAMAMQMSPRVQSDYELRQLGNLVVVDTIYGVKELRDAFGVEVRT